MRLANAKSLAIAAVLTIGSLNSFVSTAGAQTAPTQYPYPTLGAGLDAYNQQTQFAFPLNQPVNARLVSVQQIVIAGRPANVLTVQVFDPATRQYRVTTVTQDAGIPIPQPSSNLVITAQGPTPGQAVFSVVPVQSPILAPVAPVLAVGIGPRGVGIGMSEVPVYDAAIGGDILVAQPMDGIGINIGPLFISDFGCAYGGPEWRFRYQHVSLVERQRMDAAYHQAQHRQESVARPSPARETAPALTHTTPVTHTGHGGHEI